MCHLWGRLCVIMLKDKKGSHQIPLARFSLWQRYRLQWLLERYPLTELHLKIIFSYILVSRNSSSAKWSVCLSPRIHKNYQIKIRTCWRRGVWQTSEPIKLWCGSPSLKWCDWTLALKEDEYFECCSSLDHNLTNISFQSITSISPSTLSMRVSVFHTYCYRERYPHIACTHGGAEPLCVIHLSLWEAAVKQHEQKAAQPPLHHPY